MTLIPYVTYIILSLCTTVARAYRNVVILFNNSTRWATGAVVLCKTCRSAAVAVKCDTISDTTPSTDLARSNLRQSDLKKAVVIEWTRMVQMQWEVQSKQKQNTIQNFCAVVQREHSVILNNIYRISYESNLRTTRVFQSFFVFCAEWHIAQRKHLEHAK